MRLGLIFIFFSLFLNSCSLRKWRLDDNKDLASNIEPSSQIDIDISKFITSENKPIEKTKKREETLAKSKTKSEKERESHRKKGIVIVEEQKTMLRQTVLKSDDFEEKVVEVKKIEKKIENYSEDFKKTDDLSHKAWKNSSVTFKSGEKHKIAISYLGLHAADLSLQFSDGHLVGDKICYLIEGKIDSAKYYRYIYELKDLVQSYVEVERFLPVKYSLVQRETSKDVDDLQLFDMDSLKYAFILRQEKKGKKKKVDEERFLPFYIQDMASSLFFVRTLDFKKNSSYTFPVMTRGKIVDLSLKFVGREKINLLGEDFSALVLKAKGVSKEDPKKGGSFKLWISDDDRRIILRFSAKVKIGTIIGEVEEYSSN